MYKGPWAWRWGVLGCVLLLLAGCSIFVDQDQAARELSLTLDATHAVGQTFVAQHGGLEGVAFWLEPSPDLSGELLLHLRTAPEATEDVATATLPATELSGPGFYEFTFAPRQDTHGVYYYAWLELQGTGSAQVGAAAGLTYLHGATYVSHQPQDAQLTFRLLYTYTGIALDLLGATWRGVGLLWLAGLLYVVPGWALLDWFWPAELPWPVKLGMAVGVSLALYPLLLLWTNLFGLHLGVFYAWLPVVGGLAALVWRHRAWRPRQGWTALYAWAHSTDLWPDVTLLIVLGLIFGVRLLVVRMLDAPLWGDSYQHTMIAQLLVDHGGLFTSWAPYEPYQSLTVHTGFHTTVATFMWLTGVDTIPATILIGQILNGLAALTLYPLALRVACGRRWAGVGAVLVAGLVSSVPAYYVNWGRYPQLAGQVLLPLVIWLLWEAVENVETAGAATLFGGIVLAGMTLTYYRMPFYFLAFAGPWFLLWVGTHWKRVKSGWSGILLRCILLGIIAILLFSPWFGALAGSKLAIGMEKGLSAAPAWDRVRAEYRLWNDLFFYVPRGLVLSTLAALIWAVISHHWEPLSVGLWLICLSGLVAGTLINLPGANYMQNFAIFIAFYIPVGILSGWLLGQIAETVSGRWHSFAPATMMALMLLLGLRGAWHQVSIVEPQFVMVTRPDVHAMAWIREHVPPKARFLVEGFRIYNGRSAVGADAGWWIPLYTQRSNTMPPQYAIFNELPEPVDYTERVVNLVASFENLSPASQEGIALLCREEITHVYVGQGQGLVGFGVSQLFSPQEFLDHPGFELLYHEDRVYIFALTANLCAD